MSPLLPALALAPPVPPLRVLPPLPLRAWALRPWPARFSPGPGEGLREPGPGDGPAERRPPPGRADRPAGLSRGSATAGSGGTRAGRSLDEGTAVTGIG